MKPTIGRIVIYHVSESDHSDLRTNSAQHCPAIVVAVWGESCVNLKVFGDGDRAPVWKTSVMLGDQPAQWSWPERS